MTFDAVTGHFTVDGTVLVATSIGVEIAEREVFVVAPSSQIALSAIKRMAPPWTFTEGVAGREIAIVGRTALRPIDSAQAVEIGMRLARVCANQFASATDWAAMQRHLDRMVGIKRT